MRQANPVHADLPARQVVTHQGGDDDQEIHAPGQLVEIVDANREWRTVSGHDRCERDRFGRRDYFTGKFIMRIENIVG